MKYRHQSKRIIQIIPEYFDSLLTKNIGYPKLFMICERAIGKPAQQIVNNFAANRAATVSDWLFGFIFGIGSHRFPAPAGQAC